MEQHRMTIEKIEISEKEYAFQFKCEELCIKDLVAIVNGLSERIVIDSLENGTPAATIMVAQLLRFAVNDGIKQALKDTDILKDIDKDYSAIFDKDE